MDIKPSKDKIIFKLHNPCGLFNQVTCIENAVALSYFLKKDMTIHHIFNKPWNSHITHGIGIYSANKWYNKRSFVDETNVPKITDLMDIHTYGDVDFIDDQLDIESQVFTEAFYNFSDNRENEDFFSAGKRRFNPDDVSHYSFRWTLGWYSTFFMNRPAEVDLALSKTTFKKEYWELASEIAKSIGPFVGAHVRLTDNMFDHPLEHEVKAGIESLKSGYPVVIATDDPKKSTVRNNCDIILEEYIEKEFINEFKQLKFTDEVTLGLISNLVMCHAEDFIGSQGSTFTGYIQRHAGGTMKIFNEAPYEQDGPFTWNGYKMPQLKNPEANIEWGYTAKLNIWDISWWREWPEFKLNIGADSEPKKETHVR